MTWYNMTDCPEPYREVLAEVKGFTYAKYVVLESDGQHWLQHIPRLNEIMPHDGWVGCSELFVIRWAYIDEEVK